MSSQWQRRRHEEVRQRVDLDEGVAAPPMGRRDGPPGPGEEPEVLDEVGPEARALVALDVQPANGDPRHLVPGRIVRAAQGIDIDRPPGGHQRFRLASDARVLVVVGVDEHRDGPRRTRPPASLSFGRAQPPLQPAPSLSTWRGRTSRPCELLTVSTTSCARS